LTDPNTTFIPKANVTGGGDAAHHLVRLRDKLVLVILIYMPMICCEELNVTIQEMPFTGVTGVSSRGSNEWMRVAVGRVRCWAGSS